VTVDKLQTYYGFTRPPFARDLAPGQLFPSAAHKEAVARISWLVGQRSIGVVTGEVGAGKSVAARAAVSRLDASRHTTVYLPNPAIGGRGLHMHLVYALGATPRFHTASLIAQTQDLLAAENDEKNRTVVLICDEAHLLTNEQLEQLRLLTNSEMDARSPLALILLGQPTLRRRLKLGHFAALDQRISIRYHIDGLSLEETAAYITHGLKIAGRSDTLFSDDAIALIHRTARGIPRAINNLTTQALVATYADDKTIVDETSAKAAVDEATSE
jgi:type II secretory pathway predicted ATPase ExeA